MHYLAKFHSQIQVCKYQTTFLMDQGKTTAHPKNNHRMAVMVKSILYQDQVHDDAMGHSKCPKRSTISTKNTLLLPIPT